MAGNDVFRFDDTDRELGFHPVENPTPRRLTPDQVARFNRDGFLSPLPGLDAEQTESFRHYFDWLINEVVSADDRRNSYSINNYHQVCQRMHDLIRTPVFVEYATDILGPETVCWSVHAFCKLPGDGMEIPLHQDADYWPFTPTKSVTVWLAVDDVSAEPEPGRSASSSAAAGC